ALALGLASAPAFARLCQTLVAGILARDYVAAAQISGVGRLRILARHILPNIGEPLVVNVTIGAGSVLLSFTGLSFLGLGVQAPQFDWGRLMNESLQSIYVHPLASLTPGLAVILAGLAFNLTGESIAHALGITSLGDLGVRGRVRRRLSRTTSAPAVVADDGSAGAAPAILSVRGLRVGFPAGERYVDAVRGVSFDIAPGAAVGLVGESGCGKSLTALAVAQLVEEPVRVTADALRFAHTDLLDGRGHRHLLGTSLAMVFQDPMTSLNPTQRVGPQLAELARAHGGYGRREARARAVERLGAVRIDDPARRARQYPHELSGGMRQRAMIGLGVMLAPKLIIADEPTTALDVTVQQQVLDLLASIRRTDGAALLLISHDVSVIRAVCDRTMVMYAGRIVEDLPTGELPHAAHPYARLLVAAVPTMRTDLDAPLPTIPGRPPEPGEPAGCAFAPRCPLADERCRTEEPALVGRGAGRVACWHAGEPFALGQETA
ncbi:MAG: ATP-binding cassette domain-containing protein, partial [Micrococcales bacterium]|nr:ATP-binding cassette domain-containing protein [Micrococcales bacterium]